MTDTVIVGAGPYGLSIAAHLRHRGIPFRVFGHPMDSWRDHMPNGMMLKSDGFASNIADPKRQLTLRRFCAEKGIPYADTGIPVRLDTFTEYRLTFSERVRGFSQVRSGCIVARASDSLGRPEYVKRSV